MTNRKTKSRRLEAAGYRHVDGWLPVCLALDVKRKIDFYSDGVERIAETVPPRGRPKTKGKDDD